MGFHSIKSSWKNERYIETPNVSVFEHLYVNNKENKVLVIDFPITLNKKTVIHEALYSLPNETFATPVEHIQYLTSDEVDFEFDYKEIKVAIEDKLNFLTDELEEKEDKE